MDAIHIHGGNALFGETKIQGSKNAALPVMAAALLIKDVCTIENCPHISDVLHMQQLLQQLQPGIHHAQPFVVPGQVLALPAHDLPQPLADFRVVYIVIVDPALVSRVVGRVDIDALHPSLVPGQQSFEHLQVYRRGH